MKIDFTHKTALVTGAARGIGKAAAVVFAQCGADLILCDKNMDQLLISSKEIEQFGVQVLPLQADVSKQEDLEHIVDQAVERFGQIDILLNCAGICPSAKVVDLSVDEWDLVLDVNLKSIFMLSQLVARHMIEKHIKGRIVSVSSQASKIGEYGIAAYCCSKAGVNAFTQVLAQELAEYGITVNAVCPGSVFTEMQQELFITRSSLEGITQEEYKRKVDSQIPWGRMARPEEVGEFMAYLASDKAEYITGVALTIAGGSTLI
jgi:NAD(P)-dependent dehydrogenase (short-subunit alcohol dehydrogenase family)